MNWEHAFELLANGSFDEFYEAKNDSKYLAKYTIDDKSDGSRDLLAEKVDYQKLLAWLFFIKIFKVTNELNLLLKKLDSVLRKDALGLFPNIYS